MMHSDKYLVKDNTLLGGSSFVRFCQQEFGEFPGWWATTVVTYCPSRPGEHPKFLLTKPHP